MKRHLALTGSLVTSLLSPVGLASSPPLPAGVTPDALSACHGLPPLAQLKAVELVGMSGPARVLHVVGAADARELVILHPDGEDAATSGGRACERFPIGRAAGRAFGRFAGGKEQLKVFALTPPEGPACNAETCPLVLALRGAPERPLAALRTTENCDAGVALATVKLFPDRDSLQVTCRSSAGAGWLERRLLVDARVKAGSLSVLVAADTGSSEAPSPDEKRAGACASHPVGWIHVVKVSGRPLLRVLDPSGASLKNGRGSAPAREFAFDAEKAVFVATASPPLPTKVDAFAGCKRR